MRNYNVGGRIPSGVGVGGISSPGGSGGSGSSGGGGGSSWQPMVSDLIRHLRRVLIEVTRWNANALEEPLIAHDTRATEDAITAAADYIRQTDRTCQGCGGTLPAGCVCPQIMASLVSLIQQGKLPALALADIPRPVPQETGEFPPLPRGPGDHFPGCNRVDTHNGDDPNACTRDGTVLGPIGTGNMMGPQDGHG